VANRQAGGGWFVADNLFRQGRKSTMESLTKWNPFREWDPVRELDEFQNRFTSFFGRSPGHRGKDGLPRGACLPSVDIIEDDKEFLVKAELPEVKREDVHVTVQDGVLTIQGERKIQRDQKNQRFHRSERAYGSFSRSFTLPDGADATRLRAEFKDGLLKIHMPKTEKTKAKQIEIKVE